MTLTTMLMDIARVDNWTATTQVQSISTPNVCVKRHLVRNLLSEHTHRQTHTHTANQLHYPDHEVVGKKSTVRPITNLWRRTGQRRRIRDVVAALSAVAISDELQSGRAGV